MADTPHARKRPASTDEQVPESTRQTATGEAPSWGATTNDHGEFVRAPTEFRNLVSKDADAQFCAEPGRYHLYVSYACPWAHRTLITRVLKGLQSVVGVSVVHPFMGAAGWHFTRASADPETADVLYGASLLREFYDRSTPDGLYPGRITVPVLWDRKTETIVNNESSEIIRILNSEFDAFADNPELDLYPADVREQIDELNSWIYPCINNGVYRAGFAKTQAAYEKAYGDVFGALDRVETILDEHRYLTGDRFTEADLRLFTTLLRFDPVYHNHFRCNKRKLSEYRNAWAFTRDVAQLPGVMSTIRIDHIKHHYYRSHTSINPTQIIPAGPDYDLTEPHGRG